MTRYFDRQIRSGRAPSVEPAGRTNWRRATLWCAALIASIGVNGCAIRDQAATQEPILYIEDAHTSASTRVEFAPDGTRIATGGYGGEIRVWEVPSGNLLHTLDAHKDTVRGLAWLNERTLVSGADDGRLLVWDVAGEQPTHSVRTSTVTALAAVPGRSELVSGHRGGEVRRWSYPDLELLGEAGMKGRVLSVAVRPDGGQIAASNNREQVALFTPKLDLIGHLPTAGKNAQELRYSPDGRQLAAGTWFDLYFWELATGKLTVKETEHIGAIISVDYTPDGRQLVSLGRHTDSKVRLLDLESGQIARRLESHDLCGYSARIGPNGRFVATVSDDESLRVYDIQAPYRPTLRYPQQDWP